MAKIQEVLNTTEHTNRGGKMLSGCKHGDVVAVRRDGRKRVKLATAMFLKEEMECNHVIG
jgi:hypothetical protein